MAELVRPDFSSPRRVKLAREASFVVGRLTAHPSTRQITYGTERQTVEPRVMQVLVALARAGGEVVSKEELIEFCWDGRVVGEDAINRVVSLLRQIGTMLGGGTFQIETIRGVGYRLIESRSSPDRLEISAPRTEGALGPISRRMAIGLSVAAAGLATAGVWFLKAPDRQPSRLAIEYYQRGLETRGQNSLELAERGAALFREATRIDPQFADAWGALAWSYRGLMHFQGTPRADEERLRALSSSAAARALELDPNNADARAALLLLKPFYRNWAEIEAGCRRLLQQNRSHSILEFNLGFTLGQVGRWRESVRYFRAVFERERFWPLPLLEWARALFSSARVQEAEDLLDEGLKRFPRHFDYWLMKVQFLAMSGRLQEARAFATDPANRPAERSAAVPEIDFQIALVEALAKEVPNGVSTVLELVSERARQFPAYLPRAAVTASLLGKLDTAFSMFDGYFFGSGPWAFGRSEHAITGWLFVAQSAALRRDERFPPLLRRTGLEDYWSTTDTLPDYRRFPEPKYRLPIG